MEAFIKEALESYDFLRVNSLFTIYNIELANKVEITLSDQISSFGMFINLSIEMECNKLSGSKNTFEKLISVSIINPSSQSSTKDEIPINVIDYSVKRGEIELKKASIKIQESCITVEVNTKELNNVEGKLKINLTTPSLYSIIPSKFIPTYLLNFKLIFHNGLDKSLFFLDHTSGISLRYRKDNSEYQSLAYSLENSNIRKMTFFPQSEIEVSYVFGRSDFWEYAKLGMPLLAGGLSILAGALTIQFVEAKLVDIAATTFAVMILPPFLQIASDKIIFYPSSDIKRLKFGNIILLTTAIVYLICLLLTISAIVPFLYPPSLFEEHKSLIYTIDLIIGSLLIMIMLCYLALLNWGVFHNYRCDGCGEKIQFRKKAKLDEQTRKTLCQLCWFSANISKVLPKK